VATPEDITQLQELVRHVHVKPSLRRYVAELSQSSRNHADVLVGVSVRGSQRLMHAAQALALTQHRDYVLPDDIQQLVPACLAHRLVLRPEARLAGITPAAVLDNLLKQVEVPVQ
jgi:MoxR-like ATPase